MRNLFVLSLVLSPLVMTLAHADCPPPIAPQRDIIADSYYDDPPVYSHIDPVRHAAYEAAVKPLEEYLRAIAKTASKGDKACAVQWLVSWAEGDAMLGKIEKEQAHYERKWMLAGLALSYAKIRDTASSDQRAAIDAWLQAVADGVRTHSDNHKGIRNNHYYWEGLAVAATGAVTGNKTDLDWGRKVFAAAENDTSADGTLPQEMKRGARALHYHLFSAEPLVMLASILDLKSAKLDTLVAFCLQGAKDLDMVGKLAGVPQIGVLPDNYDWLAPYMRRNPSSGAAAILAGRKAYVSRLGGDLTIANPLEHISAQ